MSITTDVLEQCRFPERGTAVELAVSGGADSVALAILAHARGLRARLHHVDHHLRAESGQDADLVARLAVTLGFEFVLHEVNIAPGGNLEARARAARRAALPSATMTGHSMDDLAETVILNLLRGAGVDGLSPMVGDPTKPLLDVRRAQLLSVVVEADERYVSDVTNQDTSFLRNRIRLVTLPSLNETAGRDLTPLLARQAHLMADERGWLDELARGDSQRSLSEIDCRELQGWPVARLRRWLRSQLVTDVGDGTHPPTAAEIERVIEVVRGTAVATEIGGGRRVARSAQHLEIT